MTARRQYRAGLLAASLFGTTLMVPAAAMAGPDFPSALPPVSNAGECYARVAVPAQYATGSERVVRSDGYIDLDVRQPQLRPRTEQVMVKEPSVEFRVRQPTFRTINEKIVVTPAHERLSVRPPRFSTVTERLQTGAPHLVWKRGNPGELMAQGYKIHSTADGGRLVQGSGRGYTSTTDYAANGGDRCGPGCEIWCLVEEPGTSVTTTRRVVASPAEVIRTPVPAQLQSITKQVVADPGGVEEIPVPAQYRSVTMNDIVDPGGVVERQVPAQYEDVTTRQLLSPETYEWRRVVCAPGTGTLGSGTSGLSAYGGTYSGAHSNVVSGGSTGYSGYTGYGHNGYASEPTTSYTTGGAIVGTTTGGQGYQPRYDGMGYGENSPTFSSGSTLEPSTTTDSGYYGEENYPAYGAKRKRRR